MALEKKIINEHGFYIRGIQISDSDDYLALLQHPKIKPYIPEQLLPQTIFDMIRMITILKDLYSSNTGAYWAICSPDHKLIGAVGFENWNQLHRRLEIAFELHPDYQRQGIMTQALQTIIQFGFQEMNAIRIQAFTLTTNDPSIKLLQRLNFSHEAELKKYRMFNGKIHDIQLFALINDSD